MASTDRIRIVHAHTGDRLQQARGLFQEYAGSLGIDLSFQRFDEELASLPGEYAPPAGRLLLAMEGNQALGCVALRPMEPGVCEMKRLYVSSAARGNGLGRRLVERIIAEAKEAGYRKMRLDTLPSMKDAKQLYRRMGFTEVAPYYGSPICGTAFLELGLTRSSHDA
jgi:putative acetyltransferase